MELQTLPEHIGPYRVTGRLGQGGMGEVLSGYDDRLDRPVALKRIRPGGKDPEKARQRFRREAQIVARLNHPAIVQVYDWEEAGGDDWLVMEMIDGRPLDDLLRDGPLPPEHAATIAREIASGLAVAHKAGLVHRDLKAANVMVTADDGTPEIKILDFGIAKKVDLEPERSGPKPPSTALTEAGQVIGTVRSMSPEQALGYPVDHCSDLFSLGTLLYEMLSGVSPFEGGSKVETLSRICSAREEPISDLAPNLPAGLSRLVAQLLEKQPERRPTDAHAVVTELDRLTATPNDSDIVSSVMTPQTAGPDDATLEIDIPGAGSAAARRATSEDHSTYATLRESPKWTPLAAAGILVVVVLLGVSSWRRPLNSELTTANAPGTMARPPIDQKGLSSHQLFQRGLALLERYDKKGNIDQAIAEFQRALAQEESSAPALAGLARAYWLDFYAGSLDPQRLHQALAAARKAVELNEYLAISRVSLGMAYLEMGHLEEASREFHQALQIEPLNADAHFGLSRLYDSQGKQSLAEEQIQKALEVPAANWSHAAWLGNLQLRTGHYAEAEVAFRRSLELAPDNFRAFRNLGVILYMQGDLSKAATQFQQALQIQPDETLYANLGTIYFAQGLYSQAVSAMVKATETGAGSNNYLIWGNLGDAYRWTPDNERRAQDAYLRAIQLLRPKLDSASEDPTLRTQMALYMAKRGDCDQALVDAAAQMDLPRKGARALYRLAVTNEVCNRREAALATIEMALQAGFSITEVQAEPELLELRQDVGYHQLIMKLEASGS